MSTALAPTEVRSIATVHELGVDDVIAQVQKIQRVMEAVMRKGEHYGVIGSSPKPSLLKAGAEKLCLLFRLDPEYEVTETHHDGNHLAIVSRCTLYHIPTTHRMGSGMGSCSTKESKYLYRQAKRSCPTCGQEAIIKGKAEYGGGWLCFKKQGGCGAKFGETDSVITGQPVGRIVNADLADLHNTILKMANKRALVAGVLNVTAASDIFTQDLEDLEEAHPHQPSETVVPSGKKVVPPGPAIEVKEVLVVNDEEEVTPADWTKADAPAPIEDWLTAFKEARSMTALQALWKSVTQKDVWEVFTPAERDMIVLAKDKEKQRISGGA